MDSKEDSTKGETAEMDAGTVAVGPCRACAGRRRDSRGEWVFARASEEPSRGGGGGWRVTNRKHQRLSGAVLTKPT